MHDYNAMPSNRRRVIGSSAPLELERLSSAEYKELYKSPLQVAREHCAKSEQTDFTQVDNLMMMNAFNHTIHSSLGIISNSRRECRSGSIVGFGSARLKCMGPKYGSNT